MKFAIAIPQFHADGEFDPAARVRSAQRSFLIG